VISQYPDGTKKVYSARALYCVFPILTFIVGECMGLTLIAVSIMNNTPPLFIGIFWCCAVLAGSYVNLWRVAYRLEMDGELLRWHAVMANGTVPIESIVSITPSGMPTVQRIDCLDGRSILIGTWKGFTEFACSLSEAAPGIHVKYAGATRLLGLARGKSADRREQHRP